MHYILELNQPIASFQYGTATVASGTIVLQVSKDNSYFLNCNVGIGTSGPQALLDVRKDSDEVYDFSQDLGQRAGTATIHINNNSTTVGSFGQIMYDSDSSNQGIARIVFIDSGTSAVDTAFVNESNNTKIETLRIKANGRVGIGTNDPTVALDVNGKLGLGSNFMIQNEGGTYWQRIRTVDSSTMTDNCFNFEVRLGAGSYTNLMTLLNNGNCGIGSTNPSSRLQVQQDQTAESNVIFMNNSTGANAAMRLSINVGNPAGNDPKISFNIGDGGLDWTMGVDNSDGDKFKISGGTDSHNPNLGTNDKIVIDRRFSCSKC